MAHIDVLYSNLEIHFALRNFSLVNTLFAIEIIY